MVHRYRCIACEQKFLAGATAGGCVLHCIYCGANGPVMEAVWPIASTQPARWFPPGNTLRQSLQNALLHGSPPE